MLTLNFNFKIRYKYILEQNLTFSLPWLISTKDYVNCGCLGNKERPIFHILVLKNFLFISKKSHKASRKNFSPFGVICKSHRGRGRGNTSYPSPDRVKFGTSLNHPKWKCLPPSHTLCDLFFFRMQQLSSSFGT